MVDTFLIKWRVARDVPCCNLPMSNEYTILLNSLRIPKNNYLFNSFLQKLPFTNIWFGFASILESKGPLNVNKESRKYNGPRAVFSILKKLCNHKANSKSKKFGRTTLPSSENWWLVGIGLNRSHHQTYLDKVAG